jgi:signal transduction histidine kinase
VSGRSLRLRLVAAGGAAVLGALAIAAVGLAVLFERHVERRAVDELAAHLDQLAAGIERAAAGELVMARPPADPRYSQPLSGRYWQVEAGGATLASRSLWDALLTLPPPAPGGGPREFRLAGPEGELLVLERRLILPPSLGGGAARAAVAMDRTELRAASRAFLRDLAPYLGLLAATLIAAGWAQLAVGLRPLADVGARVAAVRSGAARRLGDGFPAELRPLAAEVDALIDAREADIARARARASDLAHGLKTPLQALAGETRRLGHRGEAEAAAGIAEIAAAMQRHVDRELARARIAAAGWSACDPAAVTGRLLAVLRRTPEGRRIDWRPEFPPGLRARIDADDLTEALGALLENAARHARSRVAIRAERRDGAVVIAVGDDGPGVDAARLGELRRRGARLDGGPGAGLGLAIAGEIAEAAGGALGLRSSDAGFEAALTLPAAS